LKTITLISILFFILIQSFFNIMSKKPNEIKFSQKKLQNIQSELSSKIKKILSIKNIKTPLTSSSETTRSIDGKLVPSVKNILNHPKYENKLHSNLLTNNYHKNNKFQKKPLHNFSTFQKQSKQIASINVEINIKSMGKGLYSTDSKVQNLIHEYITLDADVVFQTDFEINPKYTILPGLDKPRCSTRRNGVVKAYSAITHTGIVRLW